LLSFLIITLPMLGIVQNGPQIAADRYTYFAAPVISMLVAAGLLRLRRSQRVAGVVGATSVILVLGALTWRQLDVWHDSESLWSRVLEIEPQSPVANVAMASLLMNEGKLEESVRRYEDALAQDPGYAEGHNNLGVALAREGKLAEAKAEYAQALRIKPDFDEPHGNLGVVLAEEGDVPGAIEEYEQALAKNPEYADAQVNWGNALVRLGKPAEALSHYAQAVADRPDDADAHFNWGVALAREGRFADAADHFRAALAINPQHADAKADLDRALRLMQERAERPR
jgi:tetratricopeptide (TPR) repeat protein